MAMAQVGLRYPVMHSGFKSHKDAILDYYKYLIYWEENLKLALIERFFWAQFQVFLQEQHGESKPSQTIVVSASVGKTYNLFQKTGNSEICSKSRTDTDAILTIFSSTVTYDWWCSRYLISNDTLRIQIPTRMWIVTKSRTDSDAILTIFSSTTLWLMRNLYPITTQKSSPRIIKSW